MSTELLARAGAQAGLGSALSSGAASQVLNLAQIVRDYAALVVAHLERAQTRCDQGAAQLQSTIQSTWMSQAAELFHTSLEGVEQNRQIITNLMQSAAENVLLAAEHLAQQFEDFAFSIIQAGETVDRIITHVASKGSATDDVVDFLRHPTVLGAQEGLESLINNPLILGVQNALGRN